MRSLRRRGGVFRSIKRETTWPQPANLPWAVPAFQDKLLITPDQKAIFDALVQRLTAPRAGLCQRHEARRRLASLMAIRGSRGSGWFDRLALGGDGLRHLAGSRVAHDIGEVIPPADGGLLKHHEMLGHARTPGLVASAAIPRERSVRHEAKLFTASVVGQVESSDMLSFYDAVRDRDVLLFPYGSRENENCSCTHRGVC